jgi:hypothetical protein
MTVAASLHAEHPFLKHLPYDALSLLYLRLDLFELGLTLLT